MIRRKKEMEQKKKRQDIVSSKGCVSMWGGEMFIRKEIGEWGRRKKNFRKKTRKVGKNLSADKNENWREIIDEKEKK